MQKTTTSTGFVSRPEIAKRLKLEPKTLESVRKRFPVQWPRYYLDLVDESNPNDPIARMGKPSQAELQQHPGDLPDPVADLKLRPVPFIVQKHRDRVIVLTTKKCHFYCRFCFRREEPPQKETELSEQDWQTIETYLRQNPEIEEPILSGGDPLTLKDHQLNAIRERLLAIPSVTKWRIHTRAPIHFPERVTPGLIDALRSDKPLRIMLHANHPREITAETQRIARLFQAAGIELYNQAVLLAGINDDVDTQVALWQSCLDLNIHPYYLHHTDPVPGNAMFRVSMERGLAIECQGRARLPEFPRYVIDQPSGAGKVPVAEVFASR
jgi:lysine 2,3-aminomutase